MKVLTLLVLLLLSSCFSSKKRENQAEKTDVKKKHSFVLDSCLCSGVDEARDILHDNTLFITDSNVLSAIENKGFGFTNLLRNMIEPSNVSNDAHLQLFINQFLDNLILSEIPAGEKVTDEINDLIPLVKTREKLVNDWEKSGPDENGNRRFLERSPYSLISIAFRPDLIENNESGDLIHAGEGRFTFQKVGSTGSTQEHFVILEYKLAMENGSLKLGSNQAVSVQPWDRKTWNEQWALLSCLTRGTEDYLNQLEKVLQRVAIADYNNPKWPNQSSIGQVRVNDFINESPWSLMEMRLDKSMGSQGNFLIRHRMPNSPKDSYATISLGAVGLNLQFLNKPFSPTGNKEIVEFIINNKNEISDLNQRFHLPPKLEAWQNTYGFRANWGKELDRGVASFIPSGSESPVAFNDIDDSIISDNEKTMAKYRLVNTSCSSCHMSGFTSDSAEFQPSFLEAGRALGFGDIPFSQNTQNLNRPLANGGFETINIREAVTNFAHFRRNFPLSEFLKEDLLHREDELEFQLSVNSCHKEEVEEIDVSLEATIDNKNPNVDEEINVRLEAKNVGANTINSLRINDVLCPAPLSFVRLLTAFNSNIESSKDWFSTKSIAPNESIGINFICKAGISLVGEEVSYSVRNNQYIFSEDQIDQNIENHEINETINVQQEEIREIDLTTNVLNQTKTDFVEGEVISYKVQLVNVGKDTASNVKFRLTCPSGTTVEGAPGATKGSYSNDIWSIDTMARGVQETIDLRCKINIGLAGSVIDFIINSEDISSNEEDKVRNEFQKVSINVINDQKQSDIKVTLKSMRDLNIKSGEDLHYRLDLENLGPEIAPRVMYKFECPEGSMGIPELETFNSGGVFQGANSRTWQLLNLGIGQKKFLEYKCKTKESLRNKVIRHSISDSNLTLESTIDGNIPNHTSGTIFTNARALRVCDFDISQPINSSQGISTLDLVVLQRHILGLKLVGEPTPNPFNLPFLENTFGGKKLDFNGDGSVSGIDLVRIRKWVLGIFRTWEEAFKNNRTVNDCDVFRPFENIRYENMDKQ